MDGARKPALGPLIASLLVAALGTGVVGVTYAWVGARLARRQVRDAADRAALRGFALWWLAMAATQALDAALDSAAALGSAGPGAVTIEGILERLLVASALAGLMVYLLYIVQGRLRLAAVGAFYLAYFTASLYAFHWRGPQGVHAGAWRVEAAFARPAPLPAEALLDLALLAPPVAGALAFGLAGRHAASLAQRARVAATSWGLLLWWVLTVASSSPQLLDASWLQAGALVVGLGTSLAILLSHAPPTWVLRRWAGRAEPVAR